MGEAWVCPRCSTDMVRGESVLLSNWHCPKCSLDWITGESLAAFLPTLKAFEKLRAAAVRGEPSTRSLRCPAGHAQSFHVVEAGDAQLDVCATCGGVALDPGELSAVKSMGITKAGRAVDSLYGIEALAHVLNLFC